MDEMVYVYMQEPEVRVLGPGNRYVLWVQGCNRACPGCTAQNAWRMEEGTPLSPETLAAEIVASARDGLTISGGEPMLQAAALYAMLEQVHAARPDLGVILYTGYKLEELEGQEAAQKLLSHVDLLIDGPYVRELDDGKSLRGSSNQRVILLTERYRDALSLYGSPERSAEVRIRGNELHMIGVVDHDIFFKAETNAKLKGGKDT